MYRPIALLLSIARLVERLVEFQLRAHVNAIGALPSNQHGFRAAHNPTTALTALVSRIVAALDADPALEVLVAGQDLKGAFETVDHSKLRRKLEHRARVCGQALLLIASYLEGRSQEPLTPLEADPQASYARVHELDLDNLTPQVACPHSVDNIRDLAAVAGTRVHQGYLGSCTNGRLDDLRVAAELMRGRQVAPGVRLVVYPASSEVEAAARAEGVLQTLEEAGASLQGASCGPCFGAIGATLAPGEVCISSSNRNFCGRMGSTESRVFLASPAVVAASCIKGVVSDPRELL